MKKFVYLESKMITSVSGSNVSRVPITWLKKIIGLVSGISYVSLISYYTYNVTKTKLNKSRQYYSLH